jgi:malonyl-CoA O-methyltransferase
MASPPSAQITQRPLDAVALARVVRRLQAAAEPPWLHGEAARRMAERLAVVKLQPERVLDWGSFVGASRACLAAAYPRAQLIGIEPDAPSRDRHAARQQSPWWSPRRWSGPAPQWLTQAEVPRNAAQLLWANMQLHGSAEPQAVFSAWHQALADGGFLMFSTLGPGSLAGLRKLYAQALWPPAMAPLVDMHDLGDMLVQAGFADPVMDQETLTLTWPDPQALLAELRALGGNVDPRRHAGLRTPRWRADLIQRLRGLAQADGRVALEVELVYGHAFKVAKPPRMAAETAIPLQQMRDLVRGNQRQP